MLLDLDFYDWSGTTETICVCQMPLTCLVCQPSDRDNCHDCILKVPKKIGRHELMGLLTNIFLGNAFASRSVYLTTSRRFDVRCKSRAS